MKRLIFGISIVGLLFCALCMAQQTNSSYVPLNDTEKKVCETMLVGISLNEFNEIEARKEYQALIKRWDAEKADFVGRVNTQIGNERIGFTGQGADFLAVSKEIREPLFTDIAKRQSMESHNQQLMDEAFREYIQTQKATLDKKIVAQKEQLKSLFIARFNEYHLDIATKQNQKTGSQELWSPVDIPPMVNGQKITLTAQTTDTGIQFLRVGTLDLTEMTLTLETKKATEGSDSFRYVTVFSLRDPSIVFTKTVSGENEILFSNGKPVAPDHFVKLAKERHQKNLQQTIISSGSGLSERAKQALARCAAHRLSSAYGKVSEAQGKQLKDQQPSGEKNQTLSAISPK